MKTKCKKHPTYKALRAPTADCKACRKMFEEAEIDRKGD